MSKKLPTHAALTPDAMLTPQEAANFLGVATSSLARWRRMKPPPIPFAAPGPRVRRYRLSDLLALAGAGHAA